MNKEIYYYTSVSGRTTFVTFDNGKNGDDWTNQKMSVKRSSILDLKPFSELIGVKVKLGNCEGIISGCLPIDEPLKGKYVGDNFYVSHKGLLNMNNLVQVHWTNLGDKPKGIPPVWQPFYKLKLMQKNVQ